MAGQWQCPGAGVVSSPPDMSVHIKAALLRSPAPIHAPGMCVRAAREGRGGGVHAVTSGRSPGMFLRLPQAQNIPTGCCQREGGDAEGSEDDEAGRLGSSGSPPLAAPGAGRWASPAPLGSCRFLPVPPPPPQPSRPPLPRGALPARQPGLLNGSCKSQRIASPGSQRDRGCRAHRQPLLWLRLSQLPLFPHIWECFCSMGVCRGGAQELLPVLTCDHQLATSPLSPLCPGRCHCTLTLPYQPELSRCQLQFPKAERED